MGRHILALIHSDKVVHVAFSKFSLIFTHSVVVAIATTKPVCPCLQGYVWHIGLHWFPKLQKFDYQAYSYQQPEANILKLQRDYYYCNYRQATYVTITPNSTSTTLISTKKERDRQTDILTLSSHPLPPSPTSSPTPNKYLHE